MSSDNEDKKEVNKNNYELFPSIWVKGCDEFLEEMPSGLRDKFWGVFGYDREERYYIPKKIAGCPENIMNILSSGKVPKSYRVAGNEVKNGDWRMKCSEVEGGKLKYKIKYAPVLK